MYCQNIQDPYPSQLALGLRIPKLSSHPIHCPSLSATTSPPPPASFHTFICSSRASLHNQENVHHCNKTDFFPFPAPSLLPPVFSPIHLPSHTTALQTSSHSSVPDRLFSTAPGSSFPPLTAAKLQQIVRTLVFHIFWVMVDRKCVRYTGGRRGGCLPVRAGVPAAGGMGHSLGPVHSIAPGHAAGKC